MGEWFPVFTANESTSSTANFSYPACSSWLDYYVPIDPVLPIKLPAWRFYQRIHPLDSSMPRRLSSRNSCPWSNCRTRRLLVDLVAPGWDAWTADFNGRTFHILVNGWSHSSEVRMESIKKTYRMVDMATGWKLRTPRKLNLKNHPLIWDYTLRQTMFFFFCLTNFWKAFWSFNIAIGKGPCKDEDDETYLLNRSKMAMSSSQTLESPEGSTQKPLHCGTARKVS